jgi:hypothetical protein
LNFPISLKNAMEGTKSRRTLTSNLHNVAGSLIKNGYEYIGDLSQMKKWANYFKHGHETIRDDEIAVQTVNSNMWEKSQKQNVKGQKI